MVDSVLVVGVHNVCCDALGGYFITDTTCIAGRYGIKDIVFRLF